MRKAFNLGLFFGLIHFVFFIFLYLLGVSPFWKFRYLGFWIPILSAGIAVWHGRESSGYEAFPFSKAFAIVFLSIFILASTKAMLIYITLTFHAKIIQLHIREASQDIQLIAQGPYKNSLPESAEKIMDLLVNESTPLNLAMNELQQHIMGGLILCFIFGLIFKKPSVSSPVQDNEKT